MTSSNGLFSLASAPPTLNLSLVATTFLSFCNEPHNLFAKVATSTTFASWSQRHFVAIRKPERQVHKDSHCGSKQERSHVVLILFLLVRVTYVWVLLFTHIHVRGESHIQHNANREVATLAARLG